MADITIEWFFSGGGGGSSPLSGREDDSFGIGLFYLGLSNEFKSLLGGPIVGPRFGQQSEFGTELFYNIAVTPWCHLTADFQVIEPSTRANDTAYLLGLRMKIDF